jgi:tetratricopeptide (TPR) repeat protein
VILLLALLAPGLVRAAESADGLEAKKKAAKTACLAGDYAKGTALLAEIYVETNNPIYIFNQGRCFQQNGRYEDAVLRFREYQRKHADAGGGHDAEAEKQIADCLSLLEIQKSREAEEKAAAAAANRTANAPVAPAQPPPFAGTPAAAQPAAPATGPAGPTAGAPAEGASWPMQKKLGFAAVGLGVLGVGVGVTGFFLGRGYLNTARDLGCTDQLCTGKAKDEYNKAQTAITVSNVGGIAGAVLLAGGIVLILTSPSPAAGARGVAVAPVVGPGLAAVALTGTF